MNVGNNGINPTPNSDLYENRSDVPQLEFGKPTRLNSDQIGKLEISINTTKSDLKEYADSHFVVINDDPIIYVTRLKLVKEDSPYNSAEAILEENLKKKYLDRAFTYPLDYTPPVPKRSNDFDRTIAEGWIEAHKSAEMKALARKVIQAFHHVSFEQFLSKLQNSVDGFNQEIMKKPQGQRQYVIAIPDNSAPKSNPWVTSLALKYLKKMPVDILRSSKMPQFLKNNPDVQTVVMCDDASFSGDQLKGYAKALQGASESTYKFHLIVPYITKYAEEKLKPYADWIAPHETMTSIEEDTVFSEEDKVILRGLTDRLLSSYFRNLECRAFFWFDHKVPDSQSTLDSILNEQGDIRCIDDNSLCKSKLIPMSMPPYKQKILEKGRKGKQELTPPLNFSEKSAKG